MRKRQAQGWHTWCWCDPFQWRGSRPIAAADLWPVFRRRTLQGCRTNHIIISCMSCSPTVLEEAVWDFHVTSGREEVFKTGDSSEQPGLLALILSITSLAGTVCIYACVCVGKRAREEQRWCCHSAAIMLKTTHAVADTVKEEPLLIFPLWNEPKKKKEHMDVHCLLALMSPFWGHESGHNDFYYRTLSGA